MYRSNRGFTLIELLVVITILGILLALLFQGINVIREESRQTQCLNNLMQIGRAMISYESTKNRLPGVLNKTVGGVQYNWVEALLPNLQHADMWDQITAGKVGAVSTMHLEIMVCPNDPYLIDPTSPNTQGLLSYGVNGGFFVSYIPTGNPPVAPVNGGTGSPAAAPILSMLVAQLNSGPGAPVHVPTTIMVTENTGNGTTAPHVLGPWTATTWSALTFTVPATSTAISGFVASNHPNKTMAVFFDGHGEKVLNTTMYPQ